ncbi:hypothetical protein DL93DRAFT_1187517 [Clavulina sp. PMI_390]|nr:hypothetical protein DL93DRAFT_1187517 [Clavulina sp. PMI_390]
MASLDTMRADRNPQYRIHYSSKKAMISGLKESSANFRKAGYDRGHSMRFPYAPLARRFSLRITLMLRNGRQNVRNSHT